jgi:hypothetical protein
VAQPGPAMFGMTLLVTPLQLISFVETLPRW